LTPVDEAHGGLDVVDRVAPGQYRPGPVRPGARRPSPRHAPSRSWRPHRAHVLRVAPVHPPRQP
jgi:hypothetical protein